MKAKSKVVAVLQHVVILCATITGASALVALSSRAAESPSLSSSLQQQSTDDVLFHSWCESMGIAINPSVKLVTTSQSVAGRGVFATKPLVKDEIVAAIPTYAMFHPHNGQSMFPQLAAQLAKIAQQESCTTNDKKSNTKRWLQKLKSLFRKRKPDSIDEEYDSVQEEIPWQVELTEYALAALKQEDGHPFAPWIRQWKRDDPVQRLFQEKVPSLLVMDDDERKETVAATALELQQMLSTEDQMPLYKIVAALNIRLQQYYDEFGPYFVSDLALPETASMYTTLYSRVVEVAEDVVGVVPFHDMINHSPTEPNVGLAISDDGTHMEIFALSDDVQAGDELFLCYFHEGKAYSEDAAVWMLVQWGIPVSKQDWKVAKTTTQ